MYSEVKIFQTLNKKMISKLWILIFLIEFVFLTSCHFPLNESPPVIPSKETEFGFDTKCLKKIFPVAKEFLLGTAIESEVLEGWSCFGNAIKAFKKKVKGGYDSQYTGQEMLRFFEDYFLDSSADVSKNLLREVMVFKQVFVGGSEEFITWSELDKIIYFTEQMKEISHSLFPYMKIFSLKWKLSSKEEQDKDIDYFDTGARLFQDSIEKISLMIEKNHKQYDMRRFPKMLIEIGTLYQARWQFLEDIEKLLPIAAKMKQTLVGGSDFLIEGNQWRRIGLMGSRGYIQYLRYFYFIKNKEHISWILDLSYTKHTIQDLFNFLGDILSGKPRSGKITLNEITELFDSLSKIYPFFKIKKIVVVELMKLKSLILGGDSDSFAANDFQNGIDKLTRIEELVRGYIQYGDIYSGKWKWKTYGTVEKSMQELNKAQENLESIALRIGSMVENDYDLSSLNTLHIELRGTTFENVTSYFPLIRALAFVVYPLNQNSVIWKKQWPFFLKSLAKAYSQYLGYQYFLENKDVNDGGISWEDQKKSGLFFKFVEGVTHALADVLGKDEFSEKAENGISLETVINVFDYLSKWKKQYYISPQFLTQFFNVKQALFGGSETVFSKQEVQKIPNKIRTAFGIGDRWTSYEEVFRMKWRPSQIIQKEDLVYFRSAEEKLIELSRLASSLLEGPYDFSNLIKLLQELTQFDWINSYDFYQMVENYRKKQSFFIALKGILLEENNQTVMKKENWPFFLETVAALYGRLLYYVYFIKENDIESENDLVAFNEFVQNIFSITKVILTRTESLKKETRGRIILPSEFDFLVDASFESSLLESPIRPATVKDLIRVILKKWLTPPKNRLKNDFNLGFNLSSLDVIQGEYKEWFNAQKFLQNLYHIGLKERLTFSGKDIQAAIKKYSKELSVNLEELSLSFKGDFSMTFNKLGFWKGFLVLQDKKVGKFSYSDAKGMNLGRAIVRWAIRSYSSNENRIFRNRQLNLIEANNIFKDLRLFAVENGLLEEDNYNFAEARFQEANLFTPDANGDVWMDFSEGVNMFLMIISGRNVNSLMEYYYLGGSRFDVLSKETKNSCITSMSTILIKYRLNLKCLIGSYWEHFGEVFLGLPEHVKFWRNFVKNNAKKEFDEYMEDLFTSVGKLEKEEDITVYRAGLIPHSIQYIEAIMTRFDEDRNGILEIDETLKAYPSFVSLIDQLAKGQLNKSQYEAAFVWIVAEGKAPETWEEKAKFLVWSNMKSLWETHADRAQIARILAYSARETEKQKIKEAEKQRIH